MYKKCLTREKESWSLDTNTNNKKETKIKCWGSNEGWSVAAVGRKRRWEEDSTQRLDAGAQPILLLKWALRPLLAPLLLWVERLPIHAADWWYPADEWYCCWLWRLVVATVTQGSNWVTLRIASSKSYKNHKMNQNHSFLEYNIKVKNFKAPCLHSESVNVTQVQFEARMIMLLLWLVILCYLNTTENVLRLKVGTMLRKRSQDPFSDKLNQREKR